MKFHDNEKQMINAAKRYFEINSNELPTGKRIKTLSLNTLYSKAYLENDFYVPYTSNVCDQTDSWVKVRKNIRMGCAVFSHINGGRLAHAYTVSGAVYGEKKIFFRVFYGKGCTAQGECFADLCAGQCGIA